MAYIAKRINLILMGSVSSTQRLPSHVVQQQRFSTGGKWQTFLSHAVSWQSLRLNPSGTSMAWEPNTPVVSMATGVNLCKGTGGKSRYLAGFYFLLQLQWHWDPSRKVQYRKAKNFLGMLYPRPMTFPFSTEQSHIIRPHPISMIEDQKAQDEMESWLIPELHE